jgi:uncharacterized ferredoxin-like protein
MRRYPSLTRSRLKGTHMPVVISRDGEKQGLLRAAELMMLSCRTAPKAGGVDDVDTLLVTGNEKDKIAAEMEKMADERKIDGFRRDADNVKRSEALLLVGVNGRKNFGMSCGACGHSTCEEFNRAAAVRGVDFEGPSCVFKALDLGIALGSAVKTAGDLNVDNRIMYRAGTAAKRLGYLSKSNVVMGIPISASGKSLYFDRKPLK